MNDVLADTYKKGQALGYARELGKYFEPGKDGLSAQKIKDAIFELGKLGGESLAQSHRHGVLAFTNPVLNNKEAADLYQLKIPNSFYPSTNHGIFTDEALNKFLTYISKLEDPDLSTSLASALASVIGEELNLQGTEDYLYSNVPFYVKSPVSETVNNLVGMTAQQIMKEVDLFDLKSFLEADEKTRATMHEEAYSLMQEDAYSTIADTIGVILNKFLISKELNRDQTSKAIVNLQKIVRQYSAQADSILHGDEF